VETLGRSSVSDEGGVGTEIA